MDHGIIPYKVFHAHHEDNILSPYTCIYPKFLKTNEPTIALVSKVLLLSLLLLFTLTPNFAAHFISWARVDGLKEFRLQLLYTDCSISAQCFPSNV